MFTDAFKLHVAGLLVGLMKWAVEQYLDFLRLVQKGKQPKYCAQPRCRREWHDHLTDVRLCKKHHPGYERSVFERMLDTP